MKQIEIELGGRSFKVDPLPIRPAKAWRERFAEPINAIISTLASADEIELNSAADIGRVLQAVIGPIVSSPDEIREMVFAYAPAMAGDREWIEANAFDEEIMGAFIEILKVVFPLGQLGNLLRSAMKVGQTGRAK